MNNYLTLLVDTLLAKNRPDRTGIGTRALFSKSLQFNMADGFPVVTTKKLAFNTICAELACFLRGYDTLEQFHEMGCKIWDANGTADYWTRADEVEGIWLGRIYGVQWRRWLTRDGKEIDQLADVIRRIKTNPSDRRLCVTAWNPGELDEMCLPPCHLYYQFFVESPGTWNARLNMFVLMRSVDIFIGMPFDIASYALLLHIVARQTGLRPSVLDMHFVDCHLYLNHIAQAVEQVDRIPKALPILQLDLACTSVDNFLPEHAKLIDYEHAESIRAPMNV